MQLSLNELKDKINTKSEISLPLIFIGKDNRYLIKTYIKAIAFNMHLTIKEIENLVEIDDIENSVFKEDDYLYIYKFNKNDALDEARLANLNIIVLSDDKVENTNLTTVNFDKLLEWQIEAYIQKLIPGLKENEIKWLCKNSKYDIYRLDNEASKLNVFDKKDQEEIFKEISDDNGYSDLNELNIFNLSNAVIKKDIIGVKSVMQDLDNIDVEGTGLVTILLKNFLTIINIQTNPKAAPESLGISEKQFRYLQYNQCNKYTIDELIDTYHFLTGIDYKLKSGLLDMTNQQLVTYIVSNII